MESRHREYNHVKILFHSLDDNNNSHSVEKAATAAASTTSLAMATSDKPANLQRYQQDHTQH